MGKDKKDQKTSEEVVEEVAPEEVVEEVAPEEVVEEVAPESPKRDKVQHMKVTPRKQQSLSEVQKRYPKGEVSQSPNGITMVQFNKVAK